MDEVFGPENFEGQIAFQTSGGSASKGIEQTADFLLWYAKDAQKVKTRRVLQPKSEKRNFSRDYSFVELPTGNSRRLTSTEIDDFSVASEDSRRFRLVPCNSQDFSSTRTTNFYFEGKALHPGQNRHWTVSTDALQRVGLADRLVSAKTSLWFKLFMEDASGDPYDAIWLDTSFAGSDKQYVVQTNAKVIERCLLMTTDPGDLVLDPTCGSGTTAVVAEQWGRRWITCDTSRVALSIARQRLMTAKFDHYRFKNDEGVKGGFVLKSVPHITLKSIAQNTHLDPIFARHQPILDACLVQCNDALLSIAPETHRVLKDKLSHKTKDSGKKSISDADRRRWELPSQFEHWTVSFDVDTDWPQALQSAVTSYRQSWRAKMDEVNACIAAHADNEELVDQPEIVRGVVRVSGPFTVEAVQPPAISLGEERVLDVAVANEKNPEYDGAPEELDSFEEELLPRGMREAIPTTPLQTENVEAYLSQMIRLLRTDGVTFPNNKRMMFSRLEATTLGDVAVHAEGRWHAHGEEDSDANGMANVAVCIGPQYGSISVGEVIEARRLSHRENYEHLVFAGFSFDAGATAEIEHKGRSRIETHMAHIRPDVNPAMNGLLKNSGRDQLFSVFGAPRIALHHDETDDEYSIEMQGMDIYDPVKNEVTPTIAGKVAAWFVDGDYDGKCFCITQAFFPDKSAWDKLERALKGTIDADVWAQLAGTKSLAFAAGKHRQAAVKVIDPRGNEVMKVVAL